VILNYSVHHNPRGWYVIFGVDGVAESTVDGFVAREDAHEWLMSYLLRREFEQAELAEFRRRSQEEMLARLLEPKEPQ
jgi:cytochrome c biogenesis protein ResB